ncbi:MAG: glycoside hydrolase family 27 protein [Victivallales bacterium]|nr:glycoside hydrolase family 27 protein [Victivallales bacterium]
MLVNTPPMGWNTWNTFAENINESVICRAADRIVELGLDKVGYQYVVIDDCWSERERDPKTHKIVPDHIKFPNGMKVVADYIHSKGLKFGMYSCDGVRTCANYPGSYDHEFLDAETFAEFGCDFLKYDNCFKPEHFAGPVLYRRMGNALRQCGRDILFSACNWGAENTWAWIRSTGAHMYRSTGDIFDSFASFAAIAKSQVPKFAFSGPQCFNDMDMLTVGMFNEGHVARGGCTFEEYRTEFALWALMGTPLMLGCNLETIKPEVLELITNRELIAFNQDPECRPAYPVQVFGAPDGVPDRLVLARMLADGDYAVGFFNLMDHEANMHCLFEQMGFPVLSGYGLRFTDVFTGEDLGLKQELLHLGKLVPHSCRVFRAHPEKV